MTWHYYTVFVLFVAPIFTVNSFLISKQVFSSKFVKFAEALSSNQHQFDLKQSSHDNTEIIPKKGILTKFKDIFLRFIQRDKQTGSISEVLTLTEKVASANDLNAILVLGASGRTGQKVLEKLLTEGNRNVVVVGRNSSKLVDLLSPYANSERLFIRDNNLDIRTIGNGKALFEGVSQIVSCLGPDFSPGKSSSSSEEIDYIATAKIVESFYQNRKDSLVNNDVEKPLLKFNAAARNLSQWSRLDDVIMGGSSSSSWKEVSWGNEGESFCRWSGTLVTEGGGFCGTVVRSLPFSTAGFDGMSLLVRGDGNRYKFRLKPDDIGSARSEYQYQAAFDTVADTWTRIHLPFESFVSVKRNDVDYSAPKVNKGVAGDRMLSLGLVLSRFDFNELPNSKCRPGPFRLDVAEVGLFRSPRPSVVLVSSAGAERINRLASFPELRARDVPIVQLNPQGILNWKYKGEQALRSSGLPYSIIRATGLVTVPRDSNSSSGEDSPTSAVLYSPRRLQAAQGDSLVGRITRDELADLVLAALDSPHSAGKTFEVRRDESESGKLENNWGAQDYNRLFRGLVRDSDRVVADNWGCLSPFPIAQDPAAPPSAERVQEILNDPRVRSQQARERDADVKQVQLVGAAPSSS